MKTDKDVISPEILAWLQLALTPQIGPMTMSKLIRHFGSAENALNQDRHTLGQFLNKSVVNLVLNKASTEAVDSALSWLNLDTNNHIIPLYDNRYPEALKQISDPPAIIFTKGRIELLQNSKVAIIGTRHPSLQGKLNAQSFSQDLAKLGLTIVSGMASGIDREAHVGALNNLGSTIGVLGTGIDRIYPLSNKDLFHQVATDGLLLSEFPLGTHALTQNFPRRNRLVAGLSLGCLVIESALDGGSMITANLALEMGRDVMAIPGSIHNPVARGCHKLIKQGAKLVENTNDILEELNMPNFVNQLTSKIPENSDPTLEIIGYDATTIDQICAKLDKPFADICAKLLELELSGHIVNCGNGKYQRIFR